MLETMRAAGITLISLALTTAVIGNAYYHKKQFYPSVVYITKSNPSMAVIYIQAFILVFLMGKLMRKVFFGQLRATEFEHLMERSWYAVTETCLAFTVFRDDFSPKFVALFTVLLFLKSFHWLAEDRVDFMERSPVISWIFHVRVLSLLTLLGVLDLLFISYAYQSTVTKGASVQLVFGFEYAILGTIIINIAIKYALHTVDLNSENPWENKAVFLLYTELVMGLMKVCLYVTFFAIMIRLYTLPLFAFRPMYYTMRKFKQAYNDVILSRRAIQNMNTLYPDVTAEELAASDNVCIICREEMTTASKKLPCNHIFHTSCLRSWFQRQQTCPTCRLNILRNPAPRPAAPQQPGPAPAPGFPFQALPGGVFGQVGPQAFPQFGGPLNFPFWQQPPPPPPPPAFRAPHPGANGPAPGAAAGTPGTQTDAEAAAGTAEGADQQPGQQNDGQQQQPQATSSSSSSSQQQHMPPFAAMPPPPFFCPPPPMFGMFPPPPMPPPDFTGLSDEELRLMEGDARENIEARLNCLRQIELLLDASITVMQQYMTTVTATHINRSASQRVPAPSQAPSAPDGPAANQPGDAELAGSSTSSSSNQNVGNASTSDLNQTEQTEHTSRTESSMSTSRGESKGREEEGKEQEEIRRLRLQKFTQDTTTANTTQ